MYVSVLPPICVNEFTDKCDKYACITNMVSLSQDRCLYQLSYQEKYHQKS